MSLDLWEATLAAAVLAAVPLLFAGVGELISEKVGVGNYGIEGVMLMGAAAGYIVAFESGSPSVGLAGGALVAAFFGLVLFVIPTVVFRAGLVLVAFSVWFIGTGLSSEIGAAYSNRPLPETMGRLEIPLLSDIPFIGEILFAHIYPVYLAVALVVLVWFVLERTRHGLAMRALGEDPSTAYANGVHVNRWRMLYMTLGAGLIGLGGAVLSVGVTAGWQGGMTGGRGWIAFALVILSAWRPLALLWTSFLVGFMLALADVGQAQGWNVPSEVLSAAPYVVTIVALVAQMVAVRSRGGGSPAPAALGRDFYVGSR